MKKHLIILAAMVFTLGSCVTTKVNVDYDKSVDFSKYKTYSFYGWAKESNKLLTPFDQERIEKAFAAEFNKRGLKFVNQGGDLTVALYIATQHKQETTATTTTTGMSGYYGYGGYWGYGPAWGWGPSFASSHTTYNTTEYREGTLIIDVFDTQKKQLIWEAVGTKRIDESSKGKEERIKKVAAAMMKDFPIKPVKK